MHKKWKYLIIIIFLGAAPLLVQLYFDVRGSRVSKFLSKRQDDLQLLGDRIQEYVKEKGEYPKFFADLIKSGKMRPDEVDFTLDGRRIMRIYQRPRSIIPSRNEIIVIEEYDDPADKYNVLLSTGYVCLDRKSIHPITLRLTSTQASN
jgi:hypothetical protein